MNRREFLTSISLLAATLAVPVSAVNPVETNMGSMNTPIEETPHTREWWKQYFRQNTQEYNPTSDETGEESRRKWIKLYNERMMQGAFVQMRQYHTDTQIDNIPVDAKSALIFRLRYGVQPADADGIPTVSIELTSVPISLM